MSRSAKKILYTLFYLSLLFLIGFGFFGFMKRDVRIPTDSDVRLQFLEVGEANFYPISPDTIFLAGTVRNNTDLVLKRASFVFKLYDSRHLFLGTVEGEIKNLFPKDKRIVQGVKIATPVKLMASLEFEATSTEWGKQLDSTQPKFLVKDEARLVVSDNNIIILGTVLNRTAFDISEAPVVTILRDKFGFTYLITGTTLFNVQKFSEREFQIVLPFLPDLVSKADGGSVETFVY